MDNTFKDLMARDLDEIFFDADAFAEEIFWDGEKITVIVEDVEAREGMLESGLEEKLIRVRRKDIHVPYPKRLPLYRQEYAQPGGALDSFDAASARRNPRV